MSRHRRQVYDDGLGLFLDTICNAFGGIIFISILLALVVQVTVSEDQPIDSQAVQRASDQLDELKREIQRLERIEAQLTGMSTHGVDQDLKNLEDEYEKRSRIVQQQEETRRMLRQTLTAHRQGLSKAEAALISLADRVRETTDQVRRTTMQLDEERRKRRLEVNLPKTRRSTKKRILFALAFDRLYTVYKDPVTEDELDAEQLKLISTVSFVPNPDRGKPMDGNEWKSTLVEILDKVTPDTHAVRLVVWADSFDSWKKVRKEFVDRGFDYSLLLLDDKEVVSFGRGGQRLVQ
ncbi:MAG: hypothetical protein ABGX16_16215 [Pirellulales bacterium]